MKSSQAHRAHVSGDMPHVETSNIVLFFKRTINFASKRRSDVQVCHQRLSSAFDLLLIFLCSLIQTLTLTPPPNNALLANMDM